MTNGKWPDEPFVPWRELAWKAFESNKLGNALERAVESLPKNCTEVLFLHDVKNLDLEATAWILNINVGEVQAMLLRARIHVYDALLPITLMSPVYFRAGEEENLSVPPRRGSAPWSEDGGHQLDALTAYL
ncbi:MAG TPA: sigma-70 region 4 domain-containing protein [Candidatus Acidoferrum sp.]|nr:sigma-70 region 4 domain-containing protein [Candidatus Acidoferrum sp.]